MAALRYQFFNAVQRGKGNAALKVLALVIMPDSGITQRTTGARFATAPQMGHLNMMASRLGVELTVIMAAMALFLQSIRVFSPQAPAVF